MKHIFDVSIKLVGPNDQLDTRPPVRQSSTISKIFFSETANQSGAFLDRGTTVCSRHLGHMTKMAPMLIYGKNLSKIFFVKPVDRFQRNVVCSIGDSCIIVCSNDDIRLTLTYFTTMSNFVTLGGPLPTIAIFQLPVFILLNNS